MQEPKSRMKYALLIALLAATSGCVVTPRYHDGYWDREHDRFWFRGGWHPCAERRDYCR